MSSSVSDNIKYPDFCEIASKNIDVFNNFKINDTYNEILEHVSHQQGLEYFNCFSDNEKITSILEKFKINDKLGSPRVYDYNFGTFSPTTLRYIKVLNELSQLDLNDKTIVEIGCGYGGQYCVLKQLFNVKKYIFIDLPPVLNLIKTYVLSLGLDENIEFHSAYDIPDVNYCDLVIANYSISECTEIVQDEYISKIINKSKNGYIIYNNMNGYKHNDFIAKTNKKIKINKEVPLTSPDNVLLTW